MPINIDFLSEYFEAEVCLVAADLSASRTTSTVFETCRLQLSYLEDKAVANMPAALRNTVDRLDKPSAYYQSRVSACLDTHHIHHF
jgi:hypothetical protein